MNDLNQVGSNDLLESSKQLFVRQQLGEKLTQFDKIINEIQKLVSSERSPKTIETLQKLLIELHQLVISAEFAKELSQKQDFLSNKNYIQLLYNIFNDESLTEETHIRAFKVMAIAINTSFISLDYIAELSNPFDFFDQFFQASHPLFPPCCICMYAIASYSSFSSIISNSPLLNQILENLNTLGEEYETLDKQSEQFNRWKGCVNILFDMLNQVLRKTDASVAIEQFNNIMTIAEGFFGMDIMPIIDSILKMILQMCNLECSLKSNQDDNKSEIINQYNMISFLTNLLSKPELINSYPIILSIFMRNYPIEGNLPLERIMEIFNNMRSANKETKERIITSILLLFQTIIQKERAVPEFFYDEDFLQYLIDIGNECTAAVSMYIGELVLILLTYTPVEKIEPIIENEEFGELVLTVFESENERTSHLIILFIKFMESMTVQGIPPESNLANFIDALQEPISELSDSEDVDIRLWAGTALKEYYYDEYKTKYHIDDDSEKIVIRLGSR